MRLLWNRHEVRSLKKLYPDTPTQQIANELGCSLSRVYAKAAQLGLVKSASYLAGEHACRLRRGDEVGKKYRFEKGHVPVNKGLRRPGWAPGRMSQTQFQKGQRPYSWKPINSLRYSKEGYLQIKVTDTGYPPRDWVGAHIMLWEDTYGPVPPGHVVVFKDRDRENVVLTNLELIPRADLMRRNTIHNLPADLKDVIRLTASLSRRIRNLDAQE